MGSQRLTTETHLARAERHATVGRALASAGDEWAAVCFFYAAYHTVKAALLEDVVFDSYDSCQSRHPDLIPDDRHTARHKGRKNTSAGREWGINELVLLLYRGAAGKYDRLHQASIDVRYQSGLRASVEEIIALYEEFEALEASQALTSNP